MADNNLLVQAPSAVAFPIGSKPVALGGRQGETLVSDVHGKWHAAARDQNVFVGSVTGVTVPVIAATLASVFSLYNPAGSNKYLEVVSTELGLVLATTVVNHFGWYYQAGIGADTVIPSSITVGAARNAWVGGSAAPVGKFLSAATHTGTPALHTMLATFGATSTTVAGPIIKEHDGKLLLPPGTIISLAASTAAGTASGMAASVTWAEWPL